MQTPKRSLPNEFQSYKRVTSSSTESFPFYIKECGFCGERKFTLGKEYSYNEYLLLYTTEGTARFTKSHQTQYIQPHSVVTTACNTSMTFTRVTKEWNYFYFIISGSHAKLYYNLIRTQNSIILSNPFMNLLDLFMELYDIVSDHSQFNSNTWKNLHCSQLLHEIFTALYDLTCEINAVKELTPAQETEVNTALKYIADNYKDDLSIDTICNTIGFSKYYFCKLFKQQMGITIHQYVTEFRINKAKELLAYSKLSVTSVASNVGFKTTLAFFRAFEKSVHMTPTEYRDYY